MTFESVEDTEVRAGDHIDMLGGVAQVLRIRSYEGPLGDIVFALADTTRGSVSLTHGGWTRRVVVGGAKEGGR